MKSTPGYDRLVSAIGDGLLASRFREQISTFLGETFPDDHELDAISSYYETDVGRRDFAHNRTYRPRPATAHV